MKKNSALIFFLLISTCADAQDGKAELTEVWKPVPRVVTPGKTSQDAPSDAIILFKNKKDTANWTGDNGKPFRWKADDSSMTVNSTGGISTRRAFGDCQLHIEWRTPAEVKGNGQGRGNSGIFFMDRYELQVLDSYNNITYPNGQAGSMYKQHMPIVNACRGPGEWQTYDILFTAPQFYPDSVLKSPARITVFHNGILIHNNAELWGPTQYIGIPKYQMHGKAPLMLQDHGNPVSYRNIWIREL